MVPKVDIFICHSWSCPAGMKILAAWSSEAEKGANPANPVLRVDQYGEAASQGSSEQGRLV